MSKLLTGAVTAAVASAGLYTCVALARQPSSAVTTYPAMFAQGYVSQCISENQGNEQSCKCQENVLESDVPYATYLTYSHYAYPKGVLDEMSDSCYQYVGTTN